MFRAAIAASALALTACATGAASASAPSFTIGRTGGNIEPFRIAVAADGVVTTSGPVRVSRHRITRSTMSDLVAVAEKQRFFSLPRLIRCPKALPDFASDVVTVRSSAGTRTVTRHGDCNARFGAVYRALARAVGLR